MPKRPAGLREAAVSKDTSTMVCHYESFLSHYALALSIVDIEILILVWLLL